MTNSKYVLSRRIDAVVDRRINKEFRRRLSKDERGKVTDRHLRRLLDPKEQAKYYDLDKRVRLQDLKDQVRSLYFESLKEFLKSQNITVVAQPVGIALCNFKGIRAMLDALPTINNGRYRSCTWLSFIARKKIMEPDFGICAQIEPYVLQTLLSKDMRTCLCLKHQKQSERRH